MSDQKLRELELKLDNQQKEINALKIQLKVADNEKEELDEQLTLFKNGVRNLLNKYTPEGEVL